MFRSCHFEKNCQSPFFFFFKGKNFRLYDLLQIPLSVLVTRFFNLFGAVLPDVSTLGARIACLVFGIILTGVGRFIYLYNSLFKKTQLRLTGVQE